MEVTIGQFTFTSNFESGNLARVELVDPRWSASSHSTSTAATVSVHGASTCSTTSTSSVSSTAHGSGRKTHKVSSLSGGNVGQESLPVQYEFCLWTRPDCAGTEFENNNRTWFFFGIKGGEPGTRARLNVMNLNKQSKLYSQGMQPVMQQCYVVPGRASARWERIKEKCSYRSEESNTVISWIHTVSEIPGTLTKYAFTYPFTYTEMQNLLDSIDKRFSQDSPSLYYHRELLVRSLDGWRLDLLTISSHLDKALEREARLVGLFPEVNNPRPFKFPNKKVVFVSARVHPGETPSSFVFNGFLNFILSNDPRAVKLRDKFVFKLIPILNPDGVVRGHYRTDQRGVNLNRVYIDPSLQYHPTIYAARQVILYHHKGEIPSNLPQGSQSHGGEEQNTSKTDSPIILPTPPVFDEDTCHSFSDVATSKNLDVPANRTRGQSVMELDEPSASGWDISSNVSADVGPTTSQCHHLLEVTDVHDDCSNISCISEAETGVTSMFGSLATVNDFSNLIPTTSNENSGSGTTSLMAPKLGFSACTSTKLEQQEKGTLEVLQQGFMKESSNESFKCNTVSDTISTTKCKYDIESSVTKTFSCFGDAVNTEKKLDSLSVSVSLPEPKLSFTHPSVLSSHFGEESIEKGIHSNKDLSFGRTLASSSESEAESGKPGQEAMELKSLEGARKNTELMSLAPDAFTPNLSTPAPVPHETQVSSGLFLYVDLHGHASKRGIFIYGNWYEEAPVMVENMLYPKVLAVNCPNFDFSACNFSERNMYLKDRRDGMSKEGSGRVAIMRATGLLRSYTLECNYNTGRTYNPTPPSPLDARKSSQTPLSSPPKYNPAVFEDCGRQLGVSLLDISGDCPASRIPQSQYSSTAGVRAWLHQFLASSALSPRGQAGSGTHVNRTPSSRIPSTRTPNKPSGIVERITGPRGSTSKIGRQGPPSTPASPRLGGGRTVGRPQRVRRHSWCMPPDSENREEDSKENTQGPARSRPHSAKKPFGSAKLHSHSKPKVPKPKTTCTTKQGVARSLTFTELGESSHIGCTDPKIPVAKMTSSKHSLSASVSLTPSLSVKLSIAEAPESTPIVKKVEKIRRQRNKGLSGSTKKLKTSPSCSSGTEDSGLKSKDVSFYSLPNIEGSERKCNPLSPSQEGFYPASQSPLSPRSPLSSVCEPQTSHGSPGLGSITTTASCDLPRQPKSPGMVTSNKKVSKVLSSPSKRSNKPASLKTLSKSMDRLPAVSGTRGERLKLLPKKVKKKMSPSSVTDLPLGPGSVTDLPSSISPDAIKQAASQPTLDWIISETPHALNPDIETVPPKLKKRKKNSRKSL
ncbi:cytosolic carboxypeptidase-like protein 5 [Oratosquilla oratoria]|uniref:cytosolic carboxypeptidase-like protein 5 n=1 Tax=Oratosquilla oratoria TaxID=337810 RepID=UPI003F76F1A5